MPPPQSPIPTPPQPPPPPHPTHLVGLALPLAGALGVHPQVGVQLVGTDPQVPHPARLQAQPCRRRRQQRQEERDAQGTTLPPTRSPTPALAAEIPARRHLATPRRRPGSLARPWDKSHSGWRGRGRRRASRGDKEEEEEERTKPLPFSTPSVSRTTGDAARHLHPSPSLGSRGAGDTVAAASLGKWGSVHRRLPAGTASGASGVEGEDGKVVI